MKKLMVLAAVAAMGAMSAKADWTLVQYGQQDGSANKFAIGNATAVFNAEVTDWQNYTKAYFLSKADYDAWTEGGALQSKLAGSALASSTTIDSMVKDRGIINFNYKDSGFSGLPKDVSGTITPGYGPFPIDQLPIYTVITDGETGYFVDGVAEISNGLIFVDNARTPFKNADLKSFGTEAAPEPTSGLLMLLGFAGLALRRKRG